MGRNGPFFRTTILLLVFLLLGAFPACDKKADEGSMFHCPMHPTYISDHPGDCPICGMRLVPVETETAPPKPQLYVCPMHPEVTSDMPGRCPKCGMELVPVKGEEEGQGTHEPGGAPGDEAVRDAGKTGPFPQGLAPVKVGETARALAGIQTATARKEAMEVRIRTVGIVAPDEARVRHIHTKISGWVDKLFVNFTGQTVRKGEPVLALYSPALFSSQEEFLKARALAAGFSGSTIPEVRQGGQDLLESARKRLELFDVPEGFIKELARTGQPRRAVTLVSPVSGFVTAKSVFEGHQVEPGMELYTVTDLSRVWIEAEFYEYESQAVREGQEATISLPYDPGQSLQGRVSSIAPYLNPDTRTLQVRFDVPNADLLLKPSMFVDVLLTLRAGASVVVPDSAVMDTGMRQIVFVDRGGGSFEPREVKIGLRSGGKTQVLSGVNEGEEVVVRANFLLDSESRLQAAIGSMSTGHETHAGGGAP
jgi:multidrug efflux pump subunit AcrA (membrane-fusion protein)